MNEQVVITGVGCVGPSGLGLEMMRVALREGAPALAAVEPMDGFHSDGGSRCAGKLQDKPYGSWLSPREARRMSPASRMAVCTARAALADAGLDKQAALGDGTAVCVGTSFGSTNYTVALLQQIRDAGPLSISPLLFMETVANAHAGQVALATGATGSNVTISQREASGLLAFGRAADLIRGGRAQRVLAGSVEEVSSICHGMLDRFRALARSTATEDVERGRPFDVSRNGYVLSEGGFMCVMERAQEAQDRGASVYAKVAATARASDPSAPAADWGTGYGGLATRLTRRLRNQGVELESIDLIVSGASGSRRGDELEARVLRAAFGASLPTVLAPKAVTGEYGAGFLASALLALEPINWASTPGFETEDPQLLVTPHLGEPLSLATRILVTSLAAGGAACWLVLDSGARE
jgi:3-oxoacyl-(acyl-carrier-protein) synthase